jgi:predicted nucleic acid-binding protein
MSYATWHDGMTLTSPVYLDANVLVAVTVTKHWAYKPAARLVGELLATQATILVSLLAIQECLWALARLSYYDLAGHSSDVLFNRKIYDRWRERIFQRHAERMTTVPSMLQAWFNAGVPLAVVSKAETDFLNVAGLVPRYMHEYGLTPGDAAHLALAVTHAKTFVTTDADFQKPANSQPLAHLAVVRVTSERAAA